MGVARASEGRQLAMHGKANYADLILPVSIQVQRQQNNLYSINLPAVLLKGSGDN